ncbi:glycosyltransferase family 2 protein [Cellulomonas endometrii]|uniref:glycosyltransferase family 2 protein n=1 Tax=Cellulomonas endometrii TaxID=3036301 RepID=UPI0024AE19AC|nr:glycosyltransferase family 2 protein [Cellulomonas endometrii]
MAPLLSIVIPAYDAADYLRRALDGLVDLGDVEVVVVDDGSTDATGRIADDAAARHWNVRVVHQANAGHGGAINAGFSTARGRYVKVLDADDRLDPIALREVLRHLARLERERDSVDVLVTDYVRDRLAGRTRTTSFARELPAGRVFGWRDVRAMPRRRVLMMHALLYRTSFLREHRISLPEHTFYVDSLLVVLPLAQARRLSYLAVPLYRYTIGRPEQSVDPTVMVSRVDQQIRVSHLALAAMPTTGSVLRGDTPVELHGLLLRYVQGLCAVTSATLARGGTDGHLRERRIFWSGVQAQRPDLYDSLRRSLLGAVSNLPGRAGACATRFAYALARRVIGFS